MDPTTLLQGESVDYPSYKVTLTILEDNWRDDSEMREMDGILKKDEVREFTLSYGEFQNFGASILCHHTLAYIEEIDDDQFRVKNINGKLYLIDQATTMPSKIKCVENVRYRLIDGDYVDLGNEVLFQVTTAKGHKNPMLPNSETVKNIRYLDEGVSKAGSEIMQHPQNFIEEGEQPQLVITFRGGLMNGKEKAFHVPDGKWVEKGFLIGRDKSKVFFQTHPKLDSISREHGWINYTEQDGWTFEDKNTTSGTYVHPKQFVKAKTDFSNSYPVEMWDGIQIRVNTMIMQFNFVQI